MPVVHFDEREGWKVDEDLKFAFHDVVIVEHGKWNTVGCDFSDPHRIARQPDDAGCDPVNATVKFSAACTVSSGCCIHRSIGKTGPPAAYWCQ